MHCRKRLDANVPSHAGVSAADGAGGKSLQKVRTLPSCQCESHALLIYTLSRPSHFSRKVGSLSPEQGCGEIGLDEAHGFRRRRQLRLELALVELPPKELPPGQALVHQRIETRTVVRRLKMRELVDDHVLHQLPRYTGKLGIVGDLALADMARAPDGLHAADLPSDAGLVQTGRPKLVQFVQHRPETFDLLIRHRRTHRRRMRQDLRPRLGDPLPLLAQEHLALPECRPPLRDREDHRAVRLHADVDAADALANDLDRNTVDQVGTAVNHILTDS